MEGARLKFRSWNHNRNTSEKSSEPVHPMNRVGAVIKSGKAVIELRARDGDDVIL